MLRSCAPLGWLLRGSSNRHCPSSPQLASDPALHRRLARLSAGSFARLVELFSSREVSSSPNCASPSLPCPAPPPPSPEPLARLALAMELSRRVAGLGGTLAGLSVEHVHSFAPWIQAHGGWVSCTHPARLQFTLLLSDGRQLRFSCRIPSSSVSSMCLLSTRCLPGTVPSSDAHHA